MGEVVNLRRARKARARDERNKTADVNRAAYGRPRGERKAEEAERRRAAKMLDGHEREPER